MTHWLNTAARTPNDYPSHLWRWLDQASPNWTTVSPHQFTAAQGAAFTRLVLCGQFQVRQCCTVRGQANDPQVQITCIVTGDYKRALLKTIRNAAAELGDRMVMEPDTTIAYRLTANGMTTQAELRHFGGGPAEENFLSASLQFAIPGVVNVIDLKRLGTDNAAVPPAASDTPAAAPGKVPRAPAWPVSKTEGYVAAYHARRKVQYIELGRDVLDDRPGAAAAFKNLFGPKAIAAAITTQVGTTLHRACRSQDVLKTHTYRHLIQPLIQPKPRKPANWNAMLDGRTGDDLPDILDEISCEDDEW